jgi:osmoprotectant transport system permease protein
MLAVLALSIALSSSALPQAPPVVVASKPFGESYLLAEMFAQALELRGFAVDRRPGLGATEVAFQALRTSAIDVYPEYTGTGLLVLLRDSVQSDARKVFQRVASEFDRQWQVHWLPPLGFENTYAIAVRSETAQREQLRTLSDLRRAAPRLRAGFSPDFIGRSDGLPGLARAYGLEFREVRPLLQSVKYRALVENEVDVIDGYSTDGLLSRYSLVVLEDDRKFFPPYEAAALVGQRLYNDMPGAIAALSALSGRITVQQMRQWNQRVEVDGEAVERVATTALQELGFALRSAATARGGTSDDSLPAYFWQRRSMLAQMLLRHLLLVFVCVSAAVLVGVPIGLALERIPGQAETTIRAIGLLQTIPGIALLAFMIPLLGIGLVPALVALFLYSLYPILRNTYSGVRSADPAAVRAAHALGMTSGQTLRYVRLPLAAPIILAGIRTAAVIAVGTATLAAFIGAGGLGDPIVSGLALSDTRMILLGALPAAALAFIVDLTLGTLERRVTPVHMRNG